MNTPLLCFEHTARTHRLFDNSWMGGGGKEKLPGDGRLDCRQILLKPTPTLTGVRRSFDNPKQAQQPDGNERQSHHGEAYTSADSVDTN